MGDMGDIFREERAYVKKKRGRRVKAFKPGPGWIKFSEQHYRYMLLGDPLDYWPSTDRFHWRSNKYRGGVPGFIKNREQGARR